MASFTIEEILAVTGGVMWAPPGVRRVGRFSTDSRTLRPGDVFVALRGERFDGRRFVAQAMDRGARGVIVQTETGRSVLSSLKGRTGQGAPRPVFVIGVDDPLRAFQDIAAFHRQRFAIPVVAVTGSNGKTTTKDMVANVLEQQWRVLKTQGNLNNCIGLPQTLLRLTAKHEAAVVEFGVDQEGQTTRLCEIARPTHGVITNVGPDHLEFFGTLDGSARAKAELLKGLPKDGLVVLNADDAYFASFKKHRSCQRLSFGMSARAQVRGSGLTSDRSHLTFHVRLPHRTRMVSMRLAVQGRHNVSNALAAIAVGHALGLSSRKIAAGLRRFRPAAMRSQIHHVAGITIMQDCYNANPASMKAAIEMLVEHAKGRRAVAVLGDMLELGAGSRRWHHEVGRYLAERPVSAFIACGIRGGDMAQGAQAGGMPVDRIHVVKDAVSAAESFRRIAQRGDVVLVKGSRGMKMEKVLETLERCGR